MNQFLILIGILVGGGIIVSILENKNRHIKRTGEIVFGTITVVFFSGVLAMLLGGALILIFGLFFWGLDFVFDLLNLPPKFEYDVASLLRSTFSFLFDDGVNIKRTFFVLWAIILLIGLKADWMKKKLAWVKVKWFSK